VFISIQKQQLEAALQQQGGKFACDPAGAARDDGCSCHEFPGSQFAPIANMINTHV
jgi:hypothetical protein